MKKLLIILIILAVAAALIVVGPSFFSGNGVVNNYRTQRVTMGQLRLAVGATGTINPVIVVNVGTQISGTIKELYVDFNDSVKAGQLLVVLDDQLFKAKVDMAKANLAHSEAQLRLTERKFERQERLYKAGSSPKEDYDTAQANLDMAKATVAQHEAALAQEVYNLSNTRIVSPVDGVVINKAVDVGQTVAASFQTPTLIDIAGDLTKMQINASFAEADVGSLTPGLDAVFSVDAYPGESFKGKLRQIRLNPTISSNVVTYDVVLDVDNPSLKLLPGMTAYVDIELHREEDVVLVPNSALTFRPLESLPGQPEGESPPSAVPQNVEQGAQQEAQIPTSQLLAASEQNKPKTGQVYVLEPTGKLRAERLTLGTTDLRSTVVVSGNLKPQDLVVIGENQPESERTLMGGGGRRF
ncbi:MAG: efflux RND transporter periplasmic adaptor subunit [Deltaproteobacteria bacterium]|jgi:HlyD family secretion protein|nr:efflux RND transporter periplasmic adaptor subunit [Deltaproteobacteria bacterium]